MNPINTDSQYSDGFSGKWLKGIFILLTFCLFFVGLRSLPLGAWLEQGAGWVRQAGALGVLIYGVLYLFATLLGGATLMTLAAGVIYGVWGGLCVVSPVSVASACVAFLLGRFVFRNAVQGRVGQSPKFRATFRALEKNGFKVVGLLRLSPVFSYTLLNYALGVTAVRLRDFAWASFLGMLPGTLLYLYFGYLLGDLAVVFSGEVTSIQENTGFVARYGKTVLLCVGLLATAMVTIYVTRLARAELKQEMRLPSSSEGG